MLLPMFGLLGCKAPPDAPAGLTDSLRLLLRDFHADDDTISAGLTGLMDWFDSDGDELLGEKAELENVGAFQLGALEPADVARLPVEGDPDPRDAPGVVSVAEMRCGLSKAQDLLVRPDQDVVFEGTWETYDRTFDTPRRSFEDTPFDEVAAVREEILEEDLGAQEDALLVTTNALSASDFGFTIEFDLAERLRHGVFEVQGEPTEALLVLSFMPHGAETDNGGHAIEQSWAIEVDLARAEKRTLRVFGAWSQLESALLPADSPLVLTQGVNEAQDTAERMSGICAGEIEIPRER